MKKLVAVEGMSSLDVAGEIAERLRQEPYILFKNDCLTKSLRFKKECLAVSIPARVVICIGLAKAKWLGHWLTMPVFHGWGEVEGRRIETSRPLGSSGVWGIVPVNIRPIIAIWI